MNRNCNVLIARASQPEAIAKTEEYLAGHLCRLLKRHETVLICFPDDGPTSLGHIFQNAVHLIGSVPLLCEPDYRWKTMLKLCLQRRATAVVAPPAVALGLAKAARATNTPISIRTVILAGYPSTPWIVDGIKKWLDCTIYGCYTPGCGPVVAGFSCNYGFGIHLRTELYSAETDPETNEITIFANDDPSVRFSTGESGVITDSPCSCGSSEVQLTELRPGLSADKRLMQLDDQLLTWSSILDYRALQTSFGIDLEVIVFPREKLPHLPSCAKLSLRAWEPDRDEPFFYQNASRIPQLPVEKC